MSATDRLRGDGLGWGGIARLGLVQAAIGAIVMLATSLLNRVMVVEYALPAALPAGLVAWHYAVQLARPLWGHGSDRGRRRTPWIVGGMGTLALGALLAVDATTIVAARPAAGMALAIAAFAMIGGGVGAAGTSLLALLAARVATERRAAAAAITWTMMVAGIAVTAGVAGALLDPFTPTRLAIVSAGVALAAFLTTLVAVHGIEGRATAPAPADAARGDFAAALRATLADPEARRFTVFVFCSMLAYAMQDLILEPFAGLLFAFSPGQSTQLSGAQHGGVLAGMILAGVGGSAFRRMPQRAWIVGGCIGSGAALAGLACAAAFAPRWPLVANVVALGFANGVFAVAAVGAMIGLAGADGGKHEGLRVGVWGAAQAIAFGLGGLVGAIAVDAGRALIGSTPDAFLLVFAAEAGLFLVAARLAAAQRERAVPVLAADHDVVVIGGGPSGATAAADLAAAGHNVLLLDRAGRIKPCGGAIPPRAIRDFAIPDRLLVARASAARMIAPSDMAVDMAVGGYVGMVDRGAFDEWLRARAADQGAVRRTGNFERIDRDPDGCAVVVYRTARGGGEQRVRARSVIGADGANSAVARNAMPGGGKTRCVFAYHEVIRAPAPAAARDYEASRCDVFYQGALSPDFYAWIFPHGDTASIGVGSAHKGFGLRESVAALRAKTGLDACETLRREGAPIPLKPLRRWDDGRDLVLAGDAAGVVAPASGEGIYYAMLGGRLAAEAVQRFLATGLPSALGQARRRFMREHGRVFWVLGILQYFWYRNDRRRERFVKMCADPDVQRLTWQAYMEKKLVRRRPAAHMRVFVKDMRHLLGSMG